MSSVMEIAMREMGQMIEMANANMKYLPGPVVNVSGYGAVADGVTDVTAAVQAAIDFAVANGMKTVFFPHGKTGQYYVTSLTNADLVDFVGDNSSFVGGFVGTITDFGAIAALKADFELYYQAGLSGFARKAFAGQTLLIDCEGDSLYSAPKSPTEQSDNPPTVVLQDILRTYYSNNNITVSNHGVGGAALYEIIGTWDATMATSTADIVYANYCINDALDKLGVADYADTYRGYLIDLVKIARKHGKIIVLETPNTVWAAKSLNVGMTVEVVDFIKDLVEVMRKVAEEMSVPLVDNFYLTQKYIESGYEGTALWDGLHASDALYRYKALQMAAPFIYPEIPRAYADTITPLYSPGIIVTEGADGAATKSKAGRFVVGKAIKIPIWVEYNNSDVYVAMSKWTNGCTSGIVKFDGEVVRSDLNLVQASGFVLDMEIMIKSKAKQGFHLIEILSNHATQQVGGTYVRVRPNKSKVYNQSPSGTSINANDVVVDRAYITNNTDAKYVLTDIPTSNFVTSRSIRFRAQLNKTNGILINWSPVDSNDVGSGIGLTLDFSTGFLTIFEYNGGIINSTTLGITDLSTSAHEYVITMGTNGSISIYVDNVLAGTVTLTTYYGGYLGFLVYGAAPQSIDYVKMA